MLSTITCFDIKFYSNANILVYMQVVSIHILAVCVVATSTADGPSPAELLANTLQVYSVKGVNPVLVNMVCAVTIAACPEHSIV